MRGTRIPTLAGVAVALWCGLFLTAPARPQEPDHDKPAAQEPGPASPISAALEKRVDGKASPDDVRLDVQWRLKTGMVSTRIYGSGVGIWNDTTQFSLTAKQVIALLKELERAHFGAMPKQYGSDEEGEEEGETESEKEREKEREKEHPREKTFFRGNITLRIGAQTKRVAQTMTGEQSAEFRQLGEKIVAAAERAAKNGGVTAKSLPDALDKLAAGKLAPQTLQLLIQRKTDKPGPGQEDGDWILRFDGRRAVDRSPGPDGKTSMAKVLELSAEDFHALAEVLRENDPAAFPKNVYSLQYVKLDVRVLSGHRDVSARRYAGTNAETHGDEQKAFDRVYAALLALHQRVAKEGAILPAGAES